ncbi:MAG: iron-containing alcohol dehydrogenase [Christensenellales bacterium]|jgi:alcohol dehydrogenase class IV
MEFSFYTANKIVFKRGALQELAQNIDGLGKHFLFLVDPVFVNTPAAESVINQFASIGAKYELFSEVRGEPTVELVDEVTAIAAEKGCDAVISLGGGSNIDVGKAVAALLTNGGSALDYLEVVGKGKKVTVDPVPFVAIPTTSGTGSEVTKNSVIGSKTACFKRSMRSDKMVPTISIVDPELTVSCPKKVTANAGIDALTHLIEAFITWRATPISDALAIKGIALAGKYLKRAYDDGSDLEAREGMSAAALIGGMAFANSGLGAAHGVGMAVGIKYHLPHGEACGIALPYVVELNAEVAGEKLDLVGEALTGKRFSKPGEGTRACIDFLFELNKAIGIPTDYKFLNIPKEEIPTLAKESLGTSMTSNPKEMDAKALEEFLAKIV